MSEPQTIHEHMISGADEAMSLPRSRSPSSPEATCQCRHQTLSNPTLSPHTNYASTPRHFSSISVVFHDWAAVRGAFVSDLANHADRLATGSVMGDFCVEPMEDRSKNQACIEGVGGSRCASCDVGVRPRSGNSIRADEDNSPE